MSYIRFTYVRKPMPERDGDKFKRGHDLGMFTAVIAFLKGVLFMHKTDAIYIGEYPHKVLHFIEHENEKNEELFSGRPSTRSIRMQFLQFSELHEFYTLQRVDVMKRLTDEHRRHRGWEVV